MKKYKFITTSIRKIFLLPLILITLSACNFTGNRVNISQAESLK